MESITRSLSAVILTACSPAWEPGTEYHLEIMGRTDLDWELIADEAEQIWDEALGGGCWFPYQRVSRASDDSKAVTLVGLERWDRSDAGYADADGIIVKDLGHVDTRSVLLHEFGHAFGLGHTDNANSLMDSHPSVTITKPSPGDGWRARRALGCTP
jgi:hypothetical protein